MSTIWTSTCGDGAKKQTNVCTNGQKLISRSSEGLTQTGEAAAAAESKQTTEHIKRSADTTDLKYLKSQDGF